MDLTLDGTQYVPVCLHMILLLSVYEVVIFTVAFLQLKNKHNIFKLLVQSHMIGKMLELR